MRNSGNLLSLAESAAHLNIIGGGMGFMFGMFLGAMGDMQPIHMINGREVPQAPLKEQVSAVRLPLTINSTRYACGGGRHYRGVALTFNFDLILEEKR